MLLNLNSLKEALGEEAYRLGAQIYARGGVREASAQADQVRYQVSTTPAQQVSFYSFQQPRCTCLEFAKKGACSHLIAAALMAQQTGVLDRLERTHALAAAPKLFAAMENALPEDSQLHMEVSLRVIEEGGAGKVTRIGLRMGEERLYVVRSIPQLIDAMDKGEMLPFGKGFAFRPEWMHFSTAHARVLEILRGLCMARKEGGEAPKGVDARLMRLPEPFAEQVLDALRETPFHLELTSGEMTVRRIHTVKLPLHFKITGNLHGLMVTGYFSKDLYPLTDSCSFVAVSGGVAAVDSDQRALVRALWQEQMGGRATFAFSMRETPRVVGELIPYLKLTGSVEIAQEVGRLLEKLPLSAKVYLDREGTEVVAKTQFHYGERVIDPFDETPLPEILGRGEKLLLRDACMERQVLDALGASGFRVSKGRVYLAGQENVYHFVSEGLKKLQEKCEVYASRDFQKMAPRRITLSGMIRMKDGRLDLELSEDTEISGELLGLMEALAKKRQYYRLKDGSFLDLSNLDAWQPLAEAVYESAAQEGAEHVQTADGLSLSAYRACYLASLLEACGLPVEQDESVRQTVRRLTMPEEETVELPGNLSLRPYQQRGFRWLHTLDRLHMGGVLADDMGLGKTVQVIALLKKTREEAEEAGRREVSLVVSPTSLTYNWLSELSRFAPEMSTMVLGGSGAQRQTQIEHVKRAMDVDVVITSYPLIRRDVELMTDIDFRFVILDEAQQIKNAGSVGAAAVKQLKAQTRFALTGTPMENSIGELWSIFDFVLPGYLGAYAAFLRKYQDGQGLDDLRRRIRPFLMRRLKRDVLGELPDKNETVMTAQMTQEQRKVYQAALLRLRDRVDQVMTEKGLSRGRSEVLAAMTELRQICCHPSLVMENYFGSSGKLDLLMDLMPEAIHAGRRILLFSQFTTMLKLLLRHLEEAGIACMYLDGDTPSAKRLEMAEKFNAGQGQAFLISLKAGGTGLNLTGADMVIHYDPWWNPATEDQATDRAHRIGQTKKVDVVRLVTHESIEEQVVALGQRKKALFDQLITPGEQLATALTEADIRALFA